MAADFSKCSKTRITGYDVAITTPTTTSVMLCIVDPCSTLDNACRAKTMLLKVLVDVLLDEGFATNIFADCGTGCSAGGPLITFIHGTYCLTYTGGGTYTIGDQTVTVPLPLDCGTTVTIV